MINQNLLEKILNNKTGDFSELEVELAAEIVKMQKMAVDDYIRLPNVAEYIRQLKA